MQRSLLQVFGWSGRRPLESRNDQEVPLSASLDRARAERSLLAFIFDNSLLLVFGTAVALVWSNLDVETYNEVADPLHFWVNDVGMVFFFALAAKEVFEATLPGGPLASRRHALSPLAAAIGGMAVPAAIYLTLVTAVGPPGLARGWAIPSATDIAFSALVARLVFPPRHAAISFLLLLAIVDDALGLVILAIFYPSGPLSFWTFGVLLTVGVAAARWLKWRETTSVWPYLLGPGAFAWAALYFGGFHPALALVPIVPFMPHGGSDLGVFDAREDHRMDTLSKFEKYLHVPVQFVLMAFGFANAGVPFDRIGAGTYYVLVALLVGKPVGVLMFTAIARRVGAHTPHELRLRDLLLVGVIASIGFTVSLFFATAAFPSGSALVETKMGAVLSFVAAPIALLLAAITRPGKRSVNHA